MHVSTALLVLQYAVFCASAPTIRTRNTMIVAPQVMIVSMFKPEAQVWYDHFHEANLGNLTSRTIALPGLSMLFPYVHCVKTGQVCQVTVGEGEINAAASTAALVLSERFDLRQTYFLLAGIAGVNPHHGTIGGVALSRFVIQVALQYEIDPRSLPQDWPSGYMSFGSRHPLEYPSIAYGTEVFELNDDLRQAAFKLASQANLTDQHEARIHHAKYSAMRGDSSDPPAAPSVILCDTTTSDVYFSGTRLAQAFESTTTVWTNGTGRYCMTAQEDAAILEVMVRAAIGGLVDFGRILVLRTGSNFDRPPPDTSDLDHLTGEDQNDFHIAVDNLFNAGVEILKGIVKDWNCTFSQSLLPSNYVGDIFGSLGGAPDFGFGSITNGKGVVAASDL